jgi:hypothetical protein
MNEKDKARRDRHTRRARRQRGALCNLTNSPEGVLGLVIIVELEGGLYFRMDLLDQGAKLEELYAVRVSTDLIRPMTGDKVTL